MSAKIHTAFVNDHVGTVGTKVHQPVNLALASLEADAGLKKTAKLSENFDIFQDLDTHIFPKDFSVQVSVDLKREKDAKLPHRVELADDVRDTVNNELRSVFRGEKESSDASVVVRILLVSDGESKGSRWKGSMNAKTKNAKLTLAWFLVSNESGEVALAKQIYLTEDCSPAASSSLDHLEFSRATVRSLARKASAQIEEELAAAIVLWKQSKANKMHAEQHDQVMANEKHEISHQHEPHEVGEDKFIFLKRLMKNLTQV